MARKPGTSDYLKFAFATVLQSDEKDWKRVGTSTDAGGQKIREFENKKTGERLTATHTAEGHFEIRGRANGEDVTLNIALPAAFAQSATKKTASSMTPAEAAKKIAAIMSDDELGDSEKYEDSWGVPPALLKKAGKALAAEYIFAVCVTDDDAEEVFAMITPARYFEKYGHCSDQSGPIDDLLPRCATTMESTWECYSDQVKTAGDFAVYLRDLGFVWNKDFQKRMEQGYGNSCIPELESALSTDKKPAQRPPYTPK